MVRYCENCGRETKLTPKEQMMQELNRNFPNASKEDLVIVCDECYQKALTLQASMN